MVMELVLASSKFRGEASTGTDMKLLPLAALLLLASSAWAGPIDDAVAANARGDYAAELRITRPLAAKGEVWAQSFLGNSYFFGQGVPKNDAEAVKWFRLAAAQGNAPAQSNLGLMYGKGQGVPMDDVRAHMWFNLAAVKGDADAVKNRDIIAKRLTPQQMAEAQKLARECQARNFKGCY